MNAHESESSSTRLTGEEPPGQALLRYMEWWCEANSWAGWQIDLQIAMARAEDPAFNWLVEQAGGWWWWPSDVDGVVFRPGSLAELRATPEVKQTG
ncbi:MAG: hypothetical protein ACLPV4_14820 [Solirubrobacteraceae bacterium]